MRKRTVLEVAFRLQYDVINVLSEQLHGIDVDLVPMQMRVLRAIWRGDNVTSQHVVAALKRDKAQVTRLVNELVARNLVYREPNPNDKRSKLLKLTDEGEHIFRQVEEVEKVVFAEMAKGIAEEDMQTFFRVADMLSENMQQME
ncbi:MAG: MarR family transcriptional regulator [Chloroflexota bacterium]